MNCSKVIASIAICCLALSLPEAASSKKRPKPDFQIKFATLAPDGSTWMKTMRAIDDEVRAKTENRLGFKFYPGGVQGDEKDVLRKIRSGQLHAGGFTGFGLGALVPEVRVLELPFMFESLDELDQLRVETDEHFFDAFDAKGFTNLGWVDVGFVYIYSKSPVKSPAEMKNAKMWAWSGDPLAEMFFRAFSVSPIPLSAPDVLTSLQTGIIDAVYGSPLAVVALQWYTRVKYMSDVPVTHALGAAIVSKKALRKVSAADIQILREIAAPRLRELTLKTREQNIEAVAELKKEGIEVITISDAARDDFFTRGRAAWSDGVGRLYSRELLERIQASLDAHRNGVGRASTKR